MRLKQIEGFERYYIADTGEVFRKMTTCLDKDGYPIIAIWVKQSKSSKMLKIHRLLAEAFIDNPERKTQVNHKNGLKRDFNLENLEWVTPLENSQHARRMGLWDPTKPRKAKKTR